jgi:hypothetical protein
MWIVIAVALLLVVVAIVVVSRRSRGPRDLDWHGAHDTSARDQHWAGAAHSGEGYGGGSGESGPGSRAGP